MSVTTLITAVREESDRGHVVIANFCKRCAMCYAIVHNLSIGTPAHEAIVNAYVAGFVASHHHDRANP